jgi:hypothetical protein
MYVGDDGGCGGRRCVYGSGDGSVMMGGYGVGSW